MLLRKVNFILGWIFRKHWLPIGILLAAFVVGLISYPEAAKNTCDTSQLAFSSKINYENLNCEFGLDTWSQVKWSFVNLFVDPGDALKNNGLRISQLLSYLAMAIVVLVGLFKESILARRYKWIDKSKHILVIGLGENNRVYLDSEFEAKNASKIIIIEADKNNPHLDAYNDKGFGIFIGTLEDYSVNFCKLENVIISAGSDRLNIDIAGELVAQINKDIGLNKLDQVTFGCNTTVLIHLSNPDYKAILHKSLLMPKVAMPLEFKVFSYEDEAARSLFEYDTVLGDYFDELVETEEDYSIIIIGDGLLAERVIYHLVMMANLPRQNKLTLYCYSKNSSVFIERLRSNFNCFDRYLDHIVLKGVDVDFNTPAAYTDDLWKCESRPNLSQIYVCHDDEATNLETVLNLHDKIYLTECLDKESPIPFKTKIHFAMFHNLALGDSISNNNEEFTQFFGFGDSRKVFHRDHLIEEAHEKISKRIHKGYGELVDLSIQGDQYDVETPWLNQAKYSDRESSRSQALHLFTKLKVLKESAGLTIKDITDIEDWKSYVEKLLLESGLTLEDITVLGCQVERYYKNIDVFKPDKDKIDNVFNRLEQSNSSLYRLVVSEHERWNTFHYLNGWEKVDEGKKEKTLKQHDCLKPLDEFVDEERRATILYDLFSVLYIPKYLGACDDFKIKVLSLIFPGFKVSKKSVHFEEEFCWRSFSFKGFIKLITTLFKDYLLGPVRNRFGIIKEGMKNIRDVLSINLSHSKKQLQMFMNRLSDFMNCKVEASEKGEELEVVVEVEKVKKNLDIWFIPSVNFTNDLQQFEEKLKEVAGLFKSNPNYEFSTLTLYTSLSDGGKILTMIARVLDKPNTIRAFVFHDNDSTVKDVVNSYVTESLIKDNISIIGDCSCKGNKKSYIEKCLIKFKDSDKIKNEEKNLPPIVIELTCP